MPRLRKLLIILTSLAAMLHHRLRSTSPTLRPESCPLCFGQLLVLDPKANQAWYFVW